MEQRFEYQEAASALIPAPPEEVFGFADEHARLASHMSSGSWRMAGGSMQVQFDAAKGKGVGARMRLGGRVLGMELSVEETVTVYEPPRRKEWETTAEPRLLVLGAYRMGFEIDPREAQSVLRVFIDYTLPDGRLVRFLGKAAAGYYARWCVRQMLLAAVSRFGKCMTDC